MANYRLYFMDPRSGHITAFESIEAADDEAAIAAAEHHRRDAAAANGRLTGPIP